MPLSNRKCPTELDNVWLKGFVITPGLKIVWLSLPGVADGEACSFGWFIKPGINMPR